MRPSADENFLCEVEVQFREAVNKNSYEIEYWDIVVLNPVSVSVSVVTTGLLCCAIVLELCRGKLGL